MATSSPPSKPSKRRRRTSGAARTLTIRLEQALNDRLQAAAKTAGQPVSQVVREAAAAYLATLEAAKPGSPNPTAEPEPVPAWAVTISKRLEAIEAAARAHETAQRDGLASLNRRVELLAAPLSLIAQQFGFKVPQAPQAAPHPAKKPAANLEQRLLDSARDSK